MKPKWLIVCAACVVVLLILSLMALNSIRYDDFAISGTIVDENGQPVDAVGIKVVAGRSKKLDFETDYDSKFYTVNGSFRFDLQNYSIVSLRFFKAGFGEQPLHFTTGGTYSGIQVVLIRKKPATQPLSPPT